MLTLLVIGIVLVVVGVIAIKAVLDDLKGV